MVIGLVAGRLQAHLISRVKSQSSQFERDLHQYFNAAVHLKLLLKVALVHLCSVYLRSLLIACHAWQVQTA